MMVGASCVEVGRNAHTHIGSFAKTDNSHIIVHTHYGRNENEKEKIWNGML